MPFVLSAAGPACLRGNYPTTDVAGGQVALWTGEFATDATDATVAAPTTSLSLSRAANSFDGPAATIAAGSLALSSAESK